MAAFFHGSRSAGSGVVAVVVEAVIVEAVVVHVGEIVLVVLVLILVLIGIGLGLGLGLGLLGLRLVELAGTAGLRLPSARADVVEAGVARKAAAGLVRSPWRAAAAASAICRLPPVSE